MDVSEECIVDLPHWDKRADLIDAGYLATPLQRYSAARHQILEQIRVIMTRVGLPSPATLDELFQIVALDTDNGRQQTVDVEIADCLAKNGFVNLPLVYTSNIPGDKVGEINGTPLSEIPLRILRQTLLAHMVLREKWDVKLNDFLEEKEAARQLKGMIDLRVIDLLETYTKNEEAALLEACAELDREILEIQQFIQKAQPA